MSSFQVLWQLPGSISKGSGAREIDLDTTTFDAKDLTAHSMYPEEHSGPAVAYWMPRKVGAHQVFSKRSQLSDQFNPNATLSMYLKQFHNENQDVESSDHWEISLKSMFLIQIKTLKQTYPWIVRQCKPRLGPPAEQLFCLAPLHPNPCSQGNCTTSSYERQGRVRGQVVPGSILQLCHLLDIGSPQCVATKAIDYSKGNIFIAVFLLVGKTVPGVNYTVLSGCQGNLVLRCAK